MAFANDRRHFGPLVPGLLMGLLPAIRSPIARRSIRAKAAAQSSSGREFIGKVVGLSKNMGR